LSIETTGGYLGVALLDFDPAVGDSRVIRSFFFPCFEKQSDSLVPSIIKILKVARLKKEAIGLVAVDAGPGSFTGIRVGLTTARTIGQTLQIPVVAVSRLEAMSWPLLQSGKPLVGAKLNALPGEIYFAVYSSKGPVRTPAWMSGAEFQKAVKKLKGRKVVWVMDEKPPHPSIIGKLAILKFSKEKNKRKFDFERALPLYLQPSWAEREKRGE